MRIQQICHSLISDLQVRCIEQEISDTDSVCAVQCMVYCILTYIPFVGCSLIIMELL